MTEQELIRLLQAVHKLDIEEREKRIAEERSNCLSLTRGRALVLNPALWTNEERSHVVSCRRCAHLIESFERNIAHPSVWVLFLWLMGRLTDEEAQAMRYHLEDDNCQRCLRVSKSLWLQSLVKMVQAGQRTVEHVMEVAKDAVTAFAPLPVQVGAFADTPRPPFQLWAQNEDGSLTVVLRETDEGELVVHVQTPDQKNAGRKVHVEVIGGKEKSLIAEVVLKSQGEYGCAGRHTFGRFAELVSQLGLDCAVVARFIQDS